MRSHNGLQLHGRGIEDAQRVAPASPWIEVKTFDWGTDDIPVRFLLQAAYYGAVTDQTLLVGILDLRGAK
jgi:hypothetical protein